MPPYRQPGNRNQIDRKLLAWCSVWAGDTALTQTELMFAFCVKPCWLSLTQHGQEEGLCMDFMGAGEQSYGEGKGHVSSATLRVKTDSRPHRRVAQSEIILHACVTCYHPGRLLA